MIFELFQWLYNTSFGTSIRESGYAYPIILSSHLFGIGFFGGMLLISNMRLMGVMLKDIPVSQVVGRFMPWKRLGVVWIITFGFLLFAAKPTEYYPNPVFWAKMTLLALTGVHALVFRSSVYQRLQEFDKMPELPPVARRAALLSTILWILIPCGGRLIAYYEVREAPAARLEQPAGKQESSSAERILATVGRAFSAPR